MVQIRIMNWNIEKLSWNKVQLNDVANAIASVVVGSDIDILVIVEVQITHLNAIMTTLTNAIDLLQPMNPSYWITSRQTNGEHYGFIIRNIDRIRPLTFAANALAPPDIPTDGTSNAPFTNLHALNWTTWPTAFPNPVPPVLPVKPRMGLTNIFMAPIHPRPTKIRRTMFAGQAVHQGGYSEGRGYRIPCLAIFVVQGPVGITYLPIVVCHYAAVRGGRNFLAQQQIAQLHQLHIAQLFSTTDAFNVRHGGYLAIDGAAVPVTNLLFTGDYNLDFRRNDPNGSRVQKTNRAALSALTPTAQMGGSAHPVATPGAALPVPVVPFNLFPPAPEATEINHQDLRASCTTQGTILKKLPRLLPPPALPNPPATLPPLPLTIIDGAIDNFFYGGTEANTAIVNFGPNQVDSGEIIDVPAHIEQAHAGGALPNFSISGLRAHYAAQGNPLVGTKYGALAPNLSGVAGGPVLTQYDRWIGARMVSDHLPVVLEITCP
jgi:hypothetical protein